MEIVNVKLHYIQSSNLLRSNIILMTFFIKKNLTKYKIHKVSHNSTNYKHCMEVREVK